MRRAGISLKTDPDIHADSIMFKNNSHFTGIRMQWVLCYLSTSSPRQISLNISQSKDPNSARRVFPQIMARL